MVATKASSWLSKAVGLLERRWFLPAVLLIGALLRLSHVFAIRGAPWLQHMQLDHRIYDEWGQRIAAGDWMGSEAYFVDPLYAYFLGTIYWIAGHRPIVVLVIQALFGVGTCYLTCLLGRRVFCPRLGSFACLLMVLYAPAVYYEALIEKTALSLFLFTLSLVLYLGNTRRQITLAGVSLGLAALTRGTFLLFIPLGTLALLLRAPAGATDASRISERSITPRLLSRIRMNSEIAGRFLMASFLVVSVLLLRNSLVAGVTTTTTNMGQNLYIGNHSGNADGTYSAPGFVRPDPRFEEADFRAEAERRLGRRLTPQEISSYWRGQALADIADHPGLAIARTLKKVRLFWHDYEVPDNGNMYLAREDSLILRLPLLSMGILFPLALLGAGLSFRSTRHARLLTVVAVVYCASIVAFFILARFRIQLLPVLAVLATFGATRLIAAVQSKSWRGITLYGGVVVAGAMFTMITPSWLAATKAPSLAIGYNNLGAVYSEEGRVDLAIAAYEKAIGIDPQSVVGAIRSVGDLYLGRGEYDKAEIHLRRVLDLKPDSRMGREALVRLYETMSRDPAYQGDRDHLRQNLASAYQRVGRVQDAEQLVGPAHVSGTKTEPSSHTSSPGPLDDTTANAVVLGLSGIGPGHPVWFSTSDRSDDGDESYRALRDLFVRAGWVVRREDRVPFPLKPGLFLFAADDRPPAYVTSIRTARVNAGMHIGLHTGYRGYFEEMKRANPTWNGFAMSPEQTFTIVVGRRPNTAGKQ